MSADFVDSNVFIYLFDDTAPDKRGRAEQLIYRGVESGNICISFQVIQETLNVLTGKLGLTSDDPDTRSLLDRVLFPLWRVMPSQRLYKRCLDLQARYRYHFYDALIIAAALEAGCKRLYSEDMQHGQQIEGLTIENPFL